MARALSPVTILDWLGRHGTRAVAISIFCGLALPQLAATFKPFYAPAIFVLLMLAFLRVDPDDLRRLFVRPKLVLIATVWTMVVLPALLGGVYVLLRLERFWPGLNTTLVLQAATPPITPSPSFAALMGLDPALSLALLVVATLVTPITTPFFGGLYLGVSLPIAPVALGVKLFLFLAGAAALSGLVRAVKGRVWVERQKSRIDGISVIFLFLFAIALMDGVAVRVWTDPLTVLAFIAIAFAAALLQIALTTLVFCRVGWEPAFVLGLAAGQRNLGLAIATVGSSISETAWLYFALAQFPIYLLPQMLKPVARFIKRRDAKNG